MCQYLTPPRKGVYYFRRPIPERLRPIIGQREWFYSLKVKDREEAKQLIPFETIRTNRLIAAAEKALADAQPIDPTAKARQRVAAEKAALQAQWEDENIAYWDNENAARDALQAEHEEKDRQLVERLPEVAGLVDRAVGHERERADRYKQQWLDVQAALRAKRRSESAGDSQDAETASPLHALPNSSFASQRTPQGNSTTVTVTGLFKAYAATGNLTPAIVTEWTKKVDRFVEFLGHDDAARVTTENIREWRNHVRDEALPGDKRRSAQTVNSGYLSPLRSAFRHGVEEGMVAHDPTKTVARVTQPKAPKIREKDFTKEEQRIILAAASAVDTSGSGGRQALVRRWVPWICAYTGARVNEITQLRADDVQQIDGYWVIKITPEAGRVKTKEFRYVPVHEHLLAQGFLALVKKQGEGRFSMIPRRATRTANAGNIKRPVSA
ncbi:DUF6538 domain-containing protein [Sphingobium fuliginis]|uniref:Core-binding (CB) domain-containing protein n=1 Tax=Sphingobium fuliginis ATCC 27551 TaxID=1208342 RepID=A0A5B8CAN1_SPHSA|nr:DUF6538 domain-containing protein [Sphingobium fuliginis]QDC36478.1 hypothetical protein FIL70_03675 [Sphingobium fuliginis ATCC 27551]